jgi:hypothetical protein
MEEPMGIDEQDGHPCRSRRQFVQLTGNGVLGMIAGAALVPAHASGAYSEASVELVSSNQGADGMALSVHEISDRLEIQDLLVRYCYAVDDRDWNAYRTMFTPDAVLDDTVTGGIKSGVEEHIAFMKRALSKILISQHAISTVLLDIRGDQAGARAHCSCPMVVDLGENRKQVFFQGLWYRDKLVRTASGWRIHALVEEGYWSHNVPEGFKF